MPKDTSFDKNASSSMGKQNRLASEKSPYLLQHAYNPVDWYSWGDDAFERSKQEDKPVFLSIGYSTCHWCHVMAHESFEDPAVAAAMNDAFICIKVDREERPDIDQVYMAVCLMMTGRGGWPLTIIMTPDKRPFFAATYIPRSGGFGQMGMLELIPTVKNLWKNKRDELLSSADMIVGSLKNAQVGENQGKGQRNTLDVSTLAAAYNDLSMTFDIQNGGFGTAPKFPTPHNLLFLLRYWLRSRDPSVLQMVETTLQAMRTGGIFDHIGFGFHRYSTDAEWFVPHFEKMLYDQALLIMAYSEAYQATGQEDYARTAREVIGYVLKAMTSNDGGFFSAEDADSESVEGKFYLWTADELRGLMDKQEYGLFTKVFDIQDAGNFEKGRNILRMRATIEDTASVIGMPEDELRSKLEDIRQRLFGAREKRIHPAKDDKILTDWNGLMIAALAKASQILDDPNYAEAAKKTADFVLLRLRKPDGRLLHRYKVEAGIIGNLDDYAFLIWGLIELYEAIFDIRYLKAALELNDDMIKHFWDDAASGFYFTPDNGEQLPVRRKEIYDGALPSGNSVAMLNLLRLSHLIGDPALEERANAIGSAFAATINKQSLGHTMLMCALDFALGPSYEIAIVGGKGDKVVDRFLEALRSRFMPNKVVLMVSGEDIHKIAEFSQNLSQLNGKATAYVCIGHKCELPTNDPEKMLELLGLLDGRGLHDGGAG